MTAVTTWNRLETRARTRDLTQPLQARVRDPLWMLSRQWQMGEYRGEDAASPIRVDYKVEVSGLTRFHAGPLTGNVVGDPYRPDTTPLEPMVEREAVALKHLDDRFAVSAARYFLTLLEAQLGSNESQKYRKHMISKKLPQLHFKSEGSRFARLMQGRVPDGRALYGYLQTGTRNGSRALPTNDAFYLVDGVSAAATTHRRRVMNAARAFLHWMAPHVDKNVGGSWQEPRLDYRFAVAAPGPGAEVVYTSEYKGGHLDWYSFDRASRRSLSAAADQPPPHWDLVLTDSLQPTPGGFPGMPEDRWWTMEDGRVNLPAMEIAPTDVARIAFLEFALVSGNDWFVLPLDLPVGGLSKVRSLRITNTFGERQTLRPVAQDGKWRMFQIDGPGARGVQPLLLAPALARGLQGTPIEEVRFLRDEAANLAWAVEALVTGRDGKPIDRDTQWRNRAAAQPTPPEPAGDEATYILASSVPDHWYPMVTQPNGGLPAIFLRRGRVQQAPGVLQEPAQGEILHGNTQFQVHNEEIPREGLNVRRAHQFARWSDGGTHHWVGRRIAVGTGEGTAGLQFDQLE